MSTTTSRWRKFPIRHLDRARYGRTQRAYTRRDGALLLLHRPRSRNAQWHDRIGTWLVVVDDNLVSRKHVYGRRVRAVPARWANSTIRRYRRGHEGLTCHLVHGRRPMIVEAIQRKPILPTELPPAVLGPNLAAEQSTTLPVAVTLELPVHPPQRLISGDRAGKLLSQTEYALYCARWQEWSAAHPELHVPHSRLDLHEIVMAEVLMLRLLLIMGRKNETPRLQRLYHAAWRRQQKVRENLGATRRQRMEFEGDGIIITKRHLRRH